MYNSVQWPLDWLTHLILVADWLPHLILATDWPPIHMAGHRQAFDWLPKPCPRLWLAPSPRSGRWLAAHTRGWTQTGTCLCRCASGLRAHLGANRRPEWKLRNNQWFHFLYSTWPIFYIYNKAYITYSIKLFKWLIIINCSNIDQIVQ